MLNGFGDRENRAVIEISRLRADSSEEELRQAASQSLADAIEAYWSLGLAAAKVNIQRETLALAERLLAREEGRRSDGLSTPLDVHRAEEAAASRRTNLYYALDQLQAAGERLKFLVNSPRAPLSLPARIPANRLRRRQALKLTTRRRYTTSTLHWRGYCTPQTPDHITFHPQIRRKNLLLQQCCR